MRYKIEKIAKRNNLKYDVVEYWGGLKGYEFSADSYSEKSFLKSLFRAKDLYIRGNIYSYYFTVMYLDDAFIFASGSRGATPEQIIVRPHR